ncbi:hypothetical protein XI04_08320 [Bradyrhizobium sp. CCBAU 11430]|nr:hypothetical protein [Bradyrhizobium sp. CCBAU 11430]
MQPSHDEDYLAVGEVKAFKSLEREKRLDCLQGWLRERLVRHRGNPNVMRLVPRTAVGQAPFLDGFRIDRT